MRHVDLFSGIGGFALAASWVWCGQYQPIAFCEIDEWCQRVLKKHWPEVPIYSDIRELKGDRFGAVDLVTGGFPCQPFSVAGKRAGEKDDRYLWPEMLRVITEAQPRWVLGENVVGIVRMELDTLLSDLEAEGYETQSFIIPACGVNAPHRRNRVWIVAHANGRRQQGQDISVRSGGSYQAQSIVSRSSQNAAYSQSASRNRKTPGQQSGKTGGRGSQSRTNVADPSRTGLAQSWTPGELSTQTGDAPTSTQRRGGLGRELGQTWWDAEPELGRVAHGIPHRVDRLRSLGNAIVPQIAHVIMQAMKRTEEIT